MHFTHREKIK